MCAILLRTSVCCLCCARGAESPNPARYYTLNGSLCCGADVTLLLSSSTPGICFSSRIGPVQLGSLTRSHALIINRNTTIYMIGVCSRRWGEVCVHVEFRLRAGAESSMRAFVTNNVRTLPLGVCKPQALPEIYDFVRAYKRRIVFIAFLL